MIEVCVGNERGDAGDFVDRPETVRKIAIKRVEISLAITESASSNAIGIGRGINVGERTIRVAPVSAAVIDNIQNNTSRRGFRIDTQMNRAPMRAEKVCARSVAAH